jgi:hypothetical protein
MTIVSLTLQSGPTANLSHSFGGATISHKVDRAISLEFGVGNGSGNANMFGFAEGTITSGNNATLDLLSGANVESPYSEHDALAWTKIKAFTLYNYGAGTLRLETGSSNGWVGFAGGTGIDIAIPTGAIPLSMASPAGWTVSGSYKTIKLSAVGGNISYYLWVFGSAT